MISLLCVCRVLTAETIAPDDSRIAYDGVYFPSMSNGYMTMPRFDAATLASKDKTFNNDRALTTTGIVIRFNADASAVTAKFLFPTAGRGVSRFSVYRDTVFVTNLVGGTAGSPFSLSIPTAAGAAQYEIVMPNWANPVFGGLDISGELLPKKMLHRKCYIAIGDSITHGTGQTMTAETYAFQIARRFGWELFNLAVGGGQISPAVAAMISNKQVDVVTILIGYNDMNGINSVESYEKSYHRILSALRNDHPKAQIFCITPTFSTTTASGNKTKTNVTLEMYREAVRRVVADETAKGGTGMYCIEGPAFTDADGLNDAVHLNVAGAAHFAAKLGDAMEKIQ